VPALPLHYLVRQILLGRTEGLTGPQVAAFLSGWSSLLEVLKRPELCVPDASLEVHDALRALALQVERAQAEILADEGETDDV